MEFLWPRMIVSRLRFRSLYINPNAQRFPMTSSPQLGYARPLIDVHDALAPAEKKPRLDANPDMVPAAKGKQHVDKKERKRRKRELPEPCSPDDVLWHDIVDLLGKHVVDAVLEEGSEWDSPFGFREEVELEVAALSSTGELASLSLTYYSTLGHTGTSLALAPSPRKPWVVATPFALPGETIRARVYRSSRLHSLADLIAVVKPNEALRDMGRVRCKYFGECGGCQYQVSRSACRETLG